MAYQYQPTPQGYNQPQWPQQTGAVAQYSYSNPYYGQPMMQQPGMRMQSTQCGGYSRCVAIVDIVFAVIGLIVALLYIGIGALVLDFINSESDRLTPEFISTGQLVGTAALILGVIGCIFYIIDMYIACGLKSAANGNLPPIQALKKANCWLYYHIVLVIFDFANAVIQTVMGNSLNSMENYNMRVQIFPLSWFPCIIRIIFIVIVCKFIQELKRVGDGNVGLMMGGGGGAATVLTTSTSAGAMPNATEPHNDNDV